MLRQISQESYRQSHLYFLTHSVLTGLILALFCQIYTLPAHGQPAPQQAEPSSQLQSQPNPNPNPDPFIDPQPKSTQIAQDKNQALANLRLGQWSIAARYLRRVLAKTPQDTQALEALRRAAIQAGRKDVLPKILATLAHAYAQTAPDIGQRRWEELVALAPQDPALKALAKIYRDSQDQNAAPPPVPISARVRSFLGIVLILGVAYAFSSHRKKISYRLVAFGLALQATFAFLVLLSPPGRWLFEQANAVVAKVLGYTDAGARFLFGKLYDGPAKPYGLGQAMLSDGGSGDPVALGSIFFIHVLPTIVFFGALMSVLYHLGLVQRFVRSIAWLMHRTMGTSGAESLSAAGNIFVGQTEAPLVIKPYVQGMTRSELMAVMTGGFATVAGGVLAAYVRFGIDAGHLMAASVMSAPAALVIAKILLPETEKSQTAGGKVLDPACETSNLVDAASQGAADGLMLALNVAAMLMAFIGLVALTDGILGSLLDGLSLKTILGYAFLPLAWCLGVSDGDLVAMGHLLGTKIAINEFVAYVDLGNLSRQISHRTTTIATYALCGFANVASVGIQIGGISAIAPERRHDLAAIGVRAMLGGAMASWLTACIAGLLL